MIETMRAARGLLMLSGAAVILAGCATKPKVPPKLETIVVPLPPNVDVAPPQEPILRVPITRSQAEDLWHLRSALNVAALLCDPTIHVQLTPNYNALLRTHRQLLTSAVEKELAQFRAEGPKWQAAYDTHMTKVYNQYSLTQRRAAFCDAAVLISSEAGMATTEALTERATTLLTRINMAAGVKIEDMIATPAAVTPAKAAPAKKTPAKAPARKRR